ncbi:hypothetical protein QQ045_005436 [Rhodiola kirilowii]
MKAFREEIQEVGLSDLGYSGAPYTFSNRRSGNLETKSRLDRTLVNSAWRELYPNNQLKHIPTTTYDHVMLLIEFNVVSRYRRLKMFRFEPMWIRKEDFESTVKEAWGSNHDSSLIMSKLKLCSEALASWSKEKFGKVQK